jgi:cyclophilin family peptidyl-prolyl cis-trans isomerase
MGGGNSTNLPNDQLSGVLPNYDPTPEQLQAAEAENEKLRNKQKKQGGASAAAAASKARQRQASEAADLENEFAASDDIEKEESDAVKPLPPSPSPLPLELNFQAVKELWFQAATGGRGRSLVELKDTVSSLAPLFNRMFRSFSATPEVGMSAKEFVFFVQTSGCDTDQDAVRSNFFECTKFPEDEDDTAEVDGIRATVGQFASAVVRIANSYVMQEFGESDQGLHEQLGDWLIKFGGKVGAKESDRDVHQMRGADFYEPPLDFVGNTPRVFLLLAWKPGDNQDVAAEEEEGKVVIELNGVSSPKCAYNFKCLCTGEKGKGEITNLELSFKGCAFHRVVAGMCVQGGDIEGSEGYGGESVYGGEFSDEPFTMLHEEAGVVSMGNSGPNTNASQFFITLAPSQHLDGENNAFGRVVEGMEHIVKIGALETDEDDKPLFKVYIKDCGVVTE